MCPLERAKMDSVCARVSKLSSVSRTLHSSTVKAGCSIMGGFFLYKAFFADYKREKRVRQTQAIADQPQSGARAQDGCRATARVARTIDGGKPSARATARVARTIHGGKP